MAIERPDWWRKAWEVAPRSQRLRDWSEEHIEITTGGRKGRFRLAANPMMGPVMDVYEHPEVRETNTMKGVQTGISQVAQNYVAKKAHTDPGQMLLVLPSKDAGRQQVKKRWKPLLSGKNCKVLKRFQRRRRVQLGRPTAKARPTQRVEDDTDRTTYENIVLTNAFDLILGYSGSVQSLASNSCQDVILDEIDKYNDWESKETSPVQLARARTETFQGTYKIHALSTPTIDTDGIAVAFENSDIKLYAFIACPHCGHAVQMLFQNITWDLPPSKDLPDHKDQAKLLLREPHRVWIECGDCKGKISDEQRMQGLASGWLADRKQEWQLHADGREVGIKPWGFSVGIHFPTIASTMGIGIVAMAAEWIEAQGNVAKIKYCKTQHHGVPYVGEQTKPVEKGLLWSKIRDSEERDFVAPPSKKVPAWASRLFLIVDTQKDHFYFIIRAYGRRRRSRLITYGMAKSFADLELLEDYMWENEDATLPSRRVFLSAIDSGGGIDRQSEDATRTRQVYRWCAKDRRRRMPLKGVRSKRYDVGAMTKLGKVDDQDPETGEKIQLPLLWVHPLDSGDNLASTISQQIELFDPLTGVITEKKTDLWELNRDVKADYVRHIEVMQKKKRRKRGREESYWGEETEGARHDFYDCERYAEAVSQDAVLGCEALPSEAEIRLKHQAAKQPAAKRVSGGVNLNVPRR